MTSRRTRLASRSVVTCRSTSSTGVDAFGSAPAARSARTDSARFAAAANIRGVWRADTSRGSTSAPCSRRAANASVPSIACAARWSAVTSLLVVVAFGSAPASRRDRTIAPEPEREARCRGV